MVRFEQECWDDGRMEYWSDVNPVCRGYDFFYNIPSFQYSTIPTAEYSIAGQAGLDREVGLWARFARAGSGHAPAPRRFPGAIADSANAGAETGYFGWRAIAGDAFSIGPAAPRRFAG